MIIIIDKGNNLAIIKHEFNDFLKILFDITFIGYRQNLKVKPIKCINSLF